MSDDLYSVEPARPSGREIPTDPNAILTEAETAFLSTLTTRTLQAYRLRGNGPPFVRLAERRIGYLRGSLNKWLIDRERISTSDSRGESQ